MHQILIVSPRGLGIGLLEQSRDPSLVVPFELRLPGGYPCPSWYSDLFDRIRGRLRLPGGYSRPSWQLTLDSNSFSIGRWLALFSRRVLDSEKSLYSPLPTSWHIWGGRPESRSGRPNSKDGINNCCGAFSFFFVEIQSFTWWTSWTGSLSFGSSADILLLFCNSFTEMYSTWPFGPFYWVSQLWYMFLISKNSECPF